MMKTFLLLTILMNLSSCFNEGQKGSGIFINHRKSIIDYSVSNIENYTKENTIQLNFIDNSGVEELSISLNNCDEKNW